MTRLSVLLLAALALLPAPAAAQVFPLFDSHIHYSRPDWDAYTASEAYRAPLREQASMVIV